MSTVGYSSPIFSSTIIGSLKQWYWMAKAVVPAIANFSLTDCETY
ncbi:hypothetical protein [Nostoc sp.]